MSDINTDSELDNVRSSKSTEQSSGIIGPFPPLDFNDAAYDSSHGNSQDETMRNKSTSEASVLAKRRDPIPSQNKQSVSGGTVQSSLMYDGNKTILIAMAKIDVKIEALTAEVRNIASMLKAITTDEEIDKTESKILKDYPLMTEADLAVVEKRLSTDAHYKNTLIKDLAIFVQSDVKGTVSKLMQEIMSNSLASNYSFHGAHKKQAFEKLKLYDVISSVIRCRFTKPLVINKEISEPIKSWLRHAPARLVRKEKKAGTMNADRNNETTEQQMNPGIATAHDESSCESVNNNQKRQANKKVNNKVVDDSVAVENSIHENIANNNDDETVVTRS